MILYRCLVVKERRKEIIEVSILLRYNNTQMEKKKNLRKKEIKDKGIIKEDSEKAEEHVIHSRSKDHNLTYK